MRHRRIRAGTYQPRADMCRVSCTFFWMDASDELVFICTVLLITGQYWLWESGLVGWASVAWLGPAGQSLFAVYLFRIAVSAGIFLILRSPLGRERSPPRWKKLIFTTILGPGCVQNPPCLYFKQRNRRAPEAFWQKPTMSEICLHYLRLRVWGLDWLATTKVASGRVIFQKRPRMTPVWKIV